jgi:hypothetical protein
MYSRIGQWKQFSHQVVLHIIQYTLPQYGNPAGDEQVDDFTFEDCMKNIERYVNRRKANTRGNKERLRDLIKIAHYAGFAYDKLKAGLEEEDVYHGNQ